MTKKPTCLSTPNPVLIQNQVTGRYQVTTDSHKKYYSAAKANKLLAKIEREISYTKSIWTAFVTLTYDNDNLPTMSVGKSIARTTKLGFNPTLPSLLPNNFEVADDTDPACIPYLTDDQADKVLSGSFAPAFSKPEHAYLQYNHIGVLLRSDLTKFFKRFRMRVIRYMTKYYRSQAYENFEKDTNVHYFRGCEFDLSNPAEETKYKYLYSHTYNKIRHDEKLYKRYIQLREEISFSALKAKHFYQEQFQSYSIGEYGGHEGCTSRPHFHILFFCKEELAYEVLRLLVFPSWNKCLPARCTVEQIRCSVSSYVSSYSSSISDYPSVFKNSAYKPFTRFSFRHHAFGSPDENYESLIQRFVEKDKHKKDEHATSFNPLVRSFSRFNNKLHVFEYSDYLLAKGVLSRFFPCPRGYARMSRDSKRNLYRKSLQVLQGTKRTFPKVVKKNFLSAWLDKVELGKFIKSYYCFDDCVVDNFTDCRAISGFINFVRQDFNLVRPLLHQYESLFDDLIETYIDIQDWFYKQYNLYLNESHFRDVSDYYSRYGLHWFDQSMLLELTKDYSVVHFEVDLFRQMENYNSGIFSHFTDLFVRFLSVGIDLSDYYEVYKDENYSCTDKQSLIDPEVYFYEDSVISSSDINRFFNPTISRVKSRLKRDAAGIPLIFRLAEDTTVLSRWALEQQERARKIKEHNGRHSNSVHGTVNDF